MHIEFKDFVDNIGIAVYSFFTIFGLLIIKVLNWLMPNIAKAFWDGVKPKLFDWLQDIFKQIIHKENELLYKKIDELNLSISKYKEQKHYLTGELKQVIEAIKTEDKEQIELLKEIYIKK